MPLLKPEPDLYPADLFETCRPEASWWVAYVRSRQEKRLARHLLEAGVDHYLPKREKRVERHGRVLRSFLPLFPSYLFFRGGGLERRAALRSQQIVHLISVPDQQGLERELRQLWGLQCAGLVLAPHPYIAAGDLVTIREGAFAGYQAEVVREKGPWRLVVTVRSLRQSVVAELDRGALQPVLERRESRRRGKPLDDVSRAVRRA